MAECYDNHMSEDDYIRVFPGWRTCRRTPSAPTGRGGARPGGGGGPSWASCPTGRYVLWRPVPAAHTRFDPTFRRGVVAAFYALTMGWGGLARCGNHCHFCHDGVLIVSTPSSTGRVDILHLRALRLV